MKGKEYNIIVEDNSPDGTLDVAKKLQKVFGKEKLIIHARPGKMGLGSAYMDGLKHCNVQWWLCIFNGCRYESPS